MFDLGEEKNQQTKNQKTNPTQETKPGKRNQKDFE